MKATRHLAVNARRRWLVAVLSTVLFAGIVASGYAYFVASASPGSAGRASATSLPTGHTPTLTKSGRVVTVHWAQNNAFAGGLLGSDPNGGYTITRYAENGLSTPSAPGTSCDGLQQGAGDPLTCAEAGLPTGRWKYTATPHYYNWDGQESPLSDSITIAPEAATSVTLANGGGVASAYVNGTKTSSIDIDVTLPATSLSSDTVHLTVSDGVPAHDVTDSKSGSAGAGTVSFSGEDLSGLNDGSLTFTATVTSSYGDGSGDTSNTYTKDTAAPTLDSVSLTGAHLNGGTTYINNANKTALGFSASWTAGPLNSASDTIAVEMSSSGGGTNATASGSRNANPRTFAADATAMNDGNVTLTATATDLAGNTSAPASSPQTIVKDTVAPDAPTSITLSNGLGASNAYINGTNKNSVNFNVGWSASANNTSSDTIDLTITSTTSASGNAARGGSSPTAINGIDAHTLSDGTVSASVTATDVAGNTSTPFTNNNAATKDTVTPNAPTLVSLTNGLGTGNQYINPSNQGSIDYSVSLGAGSLSTDTVHLKISDTTTHIIGPLDAAAPSGAGSVSFDANDLSGFTDGNVFANATSTDLAGNASTGSSLTRLKDTAPPTLNSVSLTGGNLVSGTTYINNANQASLGFSVAWTSGPLNSSIDTLSASLTSGATVTKTSARGGASPTLGFGTVDATTLTEGAVTLTATATDAAGNTSAPVSTAQTIVKDTVTPTNALALGAAPSHAFLNGTTLYYKGDTAGSFSIVNTVSDVASGPASATFPTLNMLGWTGAGGTVSTPSGGPYSSSYSWTAGQTLNPTSATVSSSDTAGNNSTGSTWTITKDITAPTGTIAAAGTSNSINLTASSVTDGAGSGTKSIDYYRCTGTGASCTGTTPISAPANWTLIGSSSAGGTWPVAWDSTAVANGSYTLKAVLTDNVGNAASTTGNGTTVAVSNTLTATTITIANGTGTAGKAEQNDVITITWNHAIALSSVCSSWASTGQTVSGVTVNMARGNGSSTNDLSFSGGTVGASACSGGINLGTIPTTSSSFIPTNTTNNWTSSTVTWNAATNQLVITLGTGTAEPTSGTVATSNFTYHPSATITLSGNPSIAATGTVSTGTVQNF